MTITSFRKAEDGTITRFCREGNRTRVLTLKGPDKLTDAVKICRTPGAIYSTSVNKANDSTLVNTSVKLPGNIVISEKDAIEIENKMHDLLETLLAKHFK